MELVIIVLTVFIFGYGMASAFSWNRERKLRDDLLKTRQKILELDLKAIHTRIHNAPIEDLLSDGESIYDEDSNTRKKL